ncbi:MAG TPA: DMT family transporter [Phycisphaerae bacterium]|nr:DMT family transporter [Phycisphaerae bacterium]
MNRPWHLPLLLTLGVFAISSAAIFIKLSDDAPPLIIAAARMTIATFALLPVMAWTRGGRLLRIPKECWIPVGLAGAMIAAHFAFWITSLKHTSVLSSVVLVTTNPLFVGIGSYVFFRERIATGLVVGILLGVAGGILITLSDAKGAAGSVYGNFLSLGGAVMMSGYLMIGRKIRRDVDAFSYLLAVNGLAAVILCAAVVIVGDSPRGLRSSTYVYFFLLGIVPQLIGHGALNYALKHVTATFIAVCILGEPVGASLFAFFFLGETVTVLQGLGGLLILAGIFSASRTGNRVGAAENTSQSV